MCGDCDLVAIPNVFLHASVRPRTADAAPEKKAAWEEITLKLWNNELP